MITSTDNEKIKLIKKLKDNKYMKEYNQFVVEGEHLVEEAYKTGYLENVYILQDNDYDFDVTKYYVSNQVMKSITTLKSIPNVIGICNIKENNKKIGNKIIICDGIQDPGNLGTIIRSAVSFNIDTLIVSEDTVNIYNEKVIRSTQGMIFNLNIIKMDLNEVISIIKENGITLIGTSMNGISLSNIQKIDKYALILGSEGSGVKKQYLELCDKVVSIEMNDLCESLNVAVAGSILMYYLR